MFDAYAYDTMYAIAYGFHDLVAIRNLTVVDGDTLIHALIHVLLADTNPAQLPPSGHAHLIKPNPIVHHPPHTAAFTSASPAQSSPVRTMPHINTPPYPTPAAGELHWSIRPYRLQRRLF